MKRKFEGIWIPEKIWLTKELTLQEKVFIVEINSLDNEDGCFASNSYFSNFFGISTTRVSIVISSLKEKGYLEEIGFDGRKRKLKSCLEEKLKAAFNKPKNEPLINVKGSFKQTLKHNNKDNSTSNNKEYKKRLLSEIFISEYPDLNNEHLEITKSFHELFKNNLIKNNASTNKIDRAKGTWIDSIRLLMTEDGETKENLIIVWKFLKTNEFWKKNILSTDKLREKFDKLLMNAKSGNRNDNNLDNLKSEIFNTLTNG